MDTRSDCVETDLLTFDIPDDVLERAAGAELLYIGTLQQPSGLGLPCGGAR